MFPFLATLNLFKSVLILRSSFDVNFFIEITIRGYDLLSSRFNLRHRLEEIFRLEQFLKLLELADGYVVRDEDLKLFKNPRQNLLIFERERLDASDE